MAVQPNPNQEMTPQAVQTAILTMKQRLSQIEGECSTMRVDAQSKVFENLANICGRYIQDLEMLKRSKEQVEATLNKIYEAHPEIKLAMEPKTKESVSEKATVKVIKKE